jgi:Mg-chelatase subunit ChlD
MDSQLALAQVKARLWLRSLSSVMYRVMRILLDNSSLMVYDTEPGQHYYQRRLYESAPGWTNGKDIYLNAKMLTPIIEAALANGQHAEMTASIKGLVFHESAHIIYSPLYQHVERLAGHRKTVMMAFNILEDQRIERLLIARWPHTKGYFKHLITELLVAGGNPSEFAHVLLFGRDYLTRKLRRTARNLFLKAHGQTMTDDVERIITSFVKLTFPRDLNTGVTLATELADLLWPTPIDETAAENDNPSGCGIGDHPDQEGRSEGKPDEQAQDTDGQSAGDLDDLDADDDLSGDGSGEPTDDESDGQEDDESGQDGTMGDPCPHGEPDDADEGDGSSGSSGDGDESGDDADGESAGEGESDEPGSSSDDAGEPDESTEAESDGDGVGTGDGTHKVLDPTDDDELREVAQQEHDDNLADESFQEDLSQTMVDVRKQLSQRPPQTVLPESSGHTVYAPAIGEPKIASQHTRRVVRELQDYVAPGWDRREDSGRFNVDSFLRRSPGTVDYFDQWNPGRERDASAEVIVLLDTSGSMNGQPIEDASKAMWVIKSSMDALKIPCTVIAFADGGRFVYRGHVPTQRAQYQRVGAGGGTSPQTSMDESMVLFAASQAKSRLLFLITDGGVDDPTETARKMDLLNAVGVTTCYIGIGLRGEQIGRANGYYRARTHGMASSPMHIPSIVRDTVKASIALSVGR